ncbi:MAG: fructose-bisphosphatase class III, partial [Bacteroidaceae bacterium]|nr:fructose-bisphosphatase class III [Bacteroidaceae bacterium]
MASARMIEDDTRYMQLLAHSFPTVAAASAEIINLSAILNLPKGTEHFLADLHGEHQAFMHVLKNASGNIKRKVNEIFGSQLREAEKRELCTLIYYPEEKLEIVRSEDDDFDDWCRVSLNQLIQVLREVSSKYTRSKVRKALPADFSYIIQELLHERTDDINKADYVKGIIETIVSTGRAGEFIIAMANVIQRLSIDSLHILGDIFDRGTGAHLILDYLQNYHHWDIQWGNHDISWMGAAAGNDACICNAIRLSLRYANMQTLEEGYGINILPLATFAMDTYGDDPCTEFQPIISKEKQLQIDDKTQRLISMMHKAISIIQFKIEAQIAERHPEWDMADRNLLAALDFNSKTCTVNGKTYAMNSFNFPTVDPQNPIRLTAEEAELMKRLHRSFRISEKLQKHIRMLLSHGCMYSIVNNNLLYHAAIPLNADGSLKDVTLPNGQVCSGKELLHQTGMLIRTAFNNDTPKETKRNAIDYFLYLWCGKDSTLFNKSKMATFERYFICDKETWVEDKGHYFTLRNNPDVCRNILDAFDVKGTNRHIINGHVPVHVNKGENPVKADGMLMVIDGGFSEPYHKETGIAGYTLVYHSRGFELVQHEAFTSTEDAVARGTDIKSMRQIVEMSGGGDKTRLAIIENEIGQVGIDTAFTESAGFTTTDLFNGCVCCTLAASLMDTLCQLEKDVDPEWVILETTGLARPHDIAESLWRYYDSDMSITV